MWQIIQGIISGVLSPLFSWLNKKEDVSLEKYKVNGQGDISAMVQDTKIIEARASLAAAMRGDKPTSFARGAFMFLTAGWYAGIVWDCFMRGMNPEWIINIKALPPNIEYIPYAIVAYLFVTAWKK